MATSLVLSGASAVAIPGTALAAPPPPPGTADFCRHFDTAPTTLNTDEIVCLSASSGYQRTSVRTSIPGGLTSRSRMQTFLADVDVDGGPDLCRYVDTPPTGSNSDELHCASAESNFQAYIPGVPIPGGFTSRLRLQTYMADVDGDGRADLCRLLDTPPTGSNSDELRCLSGASTYQSPVVAAVIAGGFTDRKRMQTYLADVDGDLRADLCRHIDSAPTSSNSDELRCLSAASGYEAPIFAVSIPGGITDRARMQTFMADVDGDGRADLCRHIDTPPTGSNSDELHCASAASGYQTPIFGVVLPGGFSARARVQSGVGSNRLIALDTAAPTVAGVTSPPANAAGWHNRTTTISWQSIDPAPTSGYPSTPSPIVTSQEGRNLTYQSEPSCDPARYCATGTLTLSLDSTPPAVAATVTPEPNGAGWRRSATVAFECADALSGLASCPDDAAVPEGRDRVVTGSAFDAAGNEGRATVSGLNVDATPPDAAVTTPSGSVFVTPVQGFEVRGVAPDRALADGSPGSGDALACFEIVQEWFVFQDESFGCINAARQPDGTWTASADLPVGIYRIRLHATDVAGNTGVSERATVYVVSTRPA